MILEYVSSKNQVVVMDGGRMVAWSVSTIYDQDTNVRKISALRNLLTVVESRMSEREWGSIRRSWYRQWNSAWKTLDNVELSPVVKGELRICYYWVRENMPYAPNSRRKQRLPNDKPNVWSLLRHRSVDVED